MFEPHPFIEALYVAVHRASGPSGLTGTVAIGVNAESGTSWLEVHLDGQAQARRVADPSDDAAWLLLGEREASSMLLEGRLPSDARLVQVAGDVGLLSRFARRYLQRLGVLDVRRGWR